MTAPQPQEHGRARVDLRDSGGAALGSRPVERFDQQAQDLAVAFADGSQLVVDGKFSGVVNHSVVDDPASVGRVRVVVDVLGRVAGGGVAAVPDQESGVGGHLQQAQVIADAAGGLERAHTAAAVDPGEPEGVPAAAFGDAGDLAEALEARASVLVSARASFRTHA